MKAPRKILEPRGLRPLKRLGQSFLDDRNCIRKIIAISDVQDDDIVVEIGAGLGIMTEEIAKRAYRVIALEIDPRLIGILQEHLASYRNVQIVCTDVLDYDFSTAVLDRKIKIIGNIPYNISSQILFRLITYRDYISQMVLMFQKELADRICAEPGSKQYGIPSVLVHIYAVCSRELVIPPHCFYPEPKVTSSVLKMIMRDSVGIELVNHDFFITVVKLAFAQRRKTLMNNLRSLLKRGYSEQEIQAALIDSGINGARRAETLSAAEMAILSNALYKAEKS